VHASVTSAVINTALPVVGVSIEVEPSLGSSGFLPSWFRPSLAAGIRQSLPRELTVPGGSVEFLWTAGNLRLCPLRFSLKSGLIETSLCAQTDLGGLRAQAQDFKQVGQKSIPWFDIGGSACAAVSLTKHAFVSTNVEVIVPYSRRPFELSNGAIVSRAPAVGLLAGLGVGLRF
jgi:hypothetical protein